MPAKYSGDATTRHNKNVEIAISVPQQISEARRILSQTGAVIRPLSDMLIDLKPSPQNTEQAFLLAQQAMDNIDLLAEIIGWIDELNLPIATGGVS